MGTNKKINETTDYMDYAVFFATEGAEITEEKLFLAAVIHFASLSGCHSSRTEKIYHEELEGHEEKD